MASSRAASFVPVPVVRWWSSKSRRERWIVAVLAQVVFAALVWGLVWQPLTRDIAAARASIARDNVALVEGQRMAGELAGLARTAPAAGDADPRVDLERVLAQQNLRAGLTQLEWKDGRARLVYSAVNFDALVAGLEALQREARLRIVDATLTARVEPGKVRAEIALAR